MNLFDDVRPSANHAKAPGPEAKTDPLDAIHSLDEPTWEQMALYYDQPHLRPKGSTTHIRELDEHFKWMPGYTNLFTGWPGDGKSEFYRQLDLLQAVFSGTKSLAFVPEDTPKEAYYDSLIFSLTGQNPDPSVPGFLPRIYYERAKDFIRQHFFVVVPKRGQGKTPQHILEIFEAGRAKLGINRFVLDPWNKCDHSGLAAAGGFQPYLVRELGNMTEWCAQEQTYLSIIAHPKGQLRPRGEARAVPDSDGVSGGQTWDDMMYTINAIYRPNKHEKRNDPHVAFYNHKIKSHRRMGAKPGSIGQGSESPDVEVTFDWQKARYLFNGVSPLDLPEVQAIYAWELASNPEPKLIRRPGFAPLPPSTFDQPAPF